MMDGNNQRSDQGEPSSSSNSDMDDRNWRSQIPPDSRSKMINKIMDVLKRTCPLTGPAAIAEREKIAVTFEEKMYTVSTSEADYLGKIDWKLLTLENKMLWNEGNNAVPSNSAEESSTRLALNGDNNRKRNSSNTNLEGSYCTKRKNVIEPTPERKKAATKNAAEPSLEPGRVATEELIFNCTICTEPLVEETSTTCGHILCKKSIEAAIAAQKACPACKRKLTKRNIHRVYLTTNPG